MIFRDLIPRRAPGLPPGQREVRTFPRFSDKPLRWAPSVTPLALEISIDGEATTHIDSDRFADFEHVDQVSDFHCVTTWTYRGARWAGVRLAQVVGATFENDLPEYAVATSADRRTATFMTLDLLADDVLLATHLDGEPLDRRHGAPLRLISPSQYGYKNVKHLIGLDFRVSQPDSTLGPKEHLRARVDREERHASLPNWSLRWPYRATIAPTARAAERGLRRSP